MLVRRRCGSALIEVLVALVLLAVAGVAMVTLVGQTGFTMRSTRGTERETSAASKVLDGIATLDRAGLLAWVGRRDVTGFRVDIVETAGDLFEVAVGTSDTSAALLRTAFYRPDSSPNAAR